VSLTDIRQGLQDYLQAQLQVRFVAGIIDGPVEDQDIGCAWTTGGARADDAESEDVTIHVRLLRQYSETTPALRDPAQLEADVDAVKAALKGIQSSLAGAWFFSVVEWESDLETNATEYVITCRRTDPFAWGG